MRSENQETRREGDEVRQDELHGVRVHGGEGEGRRELMVLLVVDLVQVLDRVRWGQYQSCQKTCGCMHHHCASLKLLPKPNARACHLSVPIDRTGSCIFLCT